MSMPSIRLDRVIFSTLHEAYKNYTTATDTISVAATALANASTRNISVVIPYTRGGTRADIYVTGSATGVKTLVNGGGRAAAALVYSYKSTETASFNVLYSSTTITVTFTITNNTGASITPNAQDLTISVVQYDAPITPI